MKIEAKIKISAISDEDGSPITFERGKVKSFNDAKRDLSKVWWSQS